MSAISLRTHERRKSAGPRLGTPSLLQQQHGDLETKKPGRSRRVKSALETRREHESSAIFPEMNRGSLDPCWGTTQYSLDYGLKKPGPPVPIRPVSPTRRHNPQPAKPFLIWKHPVRVHKHKKAVQPEADSWKFINEGFYDDYTDNYNTGDAKNEVPITNLAKIAFPGTRKKTGHTSTPHLINGITGTRAPLNDRQGSHSHSSPQRSIRPTSPQSRMLHSTLRGNTLPVFKDWLKTASSRERDVVMQMLRVADDDSEETRLRKVVNEVLQPESAERVQGWLNDAVPAEQQLLLHVLETLAVAADEDTSHLHPAENPTSYHYQHQSFRQRHHGRAHSYPITLRHKSRQSQAHYSSSGHAYSRHLQQDSRSRLHSTQNKHSPPRQALGLLGSSSGAKDPHTISLIGKRIGTQEVKQTTRQQTPELWNHRTKKKPIGASKVFPGSVWHQPTKDRGQHFSIHPEWPTA